ncbi:hypothetical protein [Streptomyces sp. NBC_01794]|uniref:hypothetical protein n=1 Tax=Streptomyces sp. NBC_01794 TaxID=2975942 RepID=UPI003084CA2B|nr:hypothetical protein OIE54_11920 [Streptomyces sp. NBC_01794]
MTSFTDDFNRADSTDLGAGWVEVSGDWSIVSTQLSPGAAGGTIILRAAGAMASNDNSAQATIAATTAASHGVWCRGSSNISSGYLWRNDGSSWDLFSVVGGSFSVIGSYAAAAAPGDVMKVQAVGSTIKGLVNGVERVSVTDTGVATGTGVGIRSESTGLIRFDDFAAADVSAGATLDTATATEAAQPLTGTKAATLAAAAETAAAQPLTGAKSAALTLAVEQDTAQPLAGAKTSALGVATAAEAAQPLTGFVTAALGTATAVETALPLTGSKTATLGTALEVDTARPLTTLSTTVPSPERTYRIPAEGRRLAVLAEPRTLAVAAEPRTLTIRR